MNQPEVTFLDGLTGPPTAGFNRKLAGLPQPGNVATWSSTGQVIVNLQVDPEFGSPMTRQHVLTPTKLCDLQISPTGLDDQTNASAEASEHVNEGIRAEQVNPATEKVAYPRLGHSENLGSGFLLQATGVDDLLDLDHQVRSDKKMLRLLASESQVTEHVAGRRRDLWAVEYDRRRADNQTATKEWSRRISS